MAVGVGGSLVAWQTVQDEGYSHGEKLHVLADEVLKQAGLQWTELDAIAVSIGPGSYTGLRIGVSAAKGWCYALGIPLISVSTLQAMAFGMTQNTVIQGDAYLVPMIDARRMEVYTAVYDLNCVEVIAPHPLVVNGNSFLDLLNKKPVFFCGDGAPKCLPLLQHPNAHFLNVLPDARWMLAPALEAFKKQLFADLAYLEPQYLKGANITVGK